MRYALTATFAAVAVLAAGCGASTTAGTTPVVANVARSPLDVPPPITRRTPERVHVHLVMREVVAELAHGERFLFWTYALPGRPPAVPGPMIRVMAGDTVVLTLTNDPRNVEPHGVDFHAVIGPGGGTKMVELEPGQTRTFTFTVHRPGAYVYHCGAEGKPWEHVSHGMFGLIEVDPPGGLPRGYRELYVGQNEWYLSSSALDEGPVSFHNLDGAKAEAASPDFVTFNGNKAALASPSLYGDAMDVHPGQKVRIFFVNGGPNLASSFHVIGEIFDRVYPDGRGHAFRNEETSLVPPGSASVFELTAGAPGMYPLVDHALWHAAEGAEGLLTVTAAAS